MLLRLLLVGAVAGLGLDLPQAPDAETWVCLDRAWWDASESESDPEPAEVSAAPVVTEAPIVTETPVVAEAPELSFETIVGEMAASFATQAAPEAAPIAVVETATPTFEPFDVDASQTLSLADLLNREFEDAPRANARNPTDVASRAARWSSAVRLTGQAVQAWVVLLKQEPSVAAVH